MIKESESEVAQSCLTPSDPMDCSPPGSSVHGLFQASVLGWAAISFSRESSGSRDRTWVSCVAGRRFTVWATTCLETWAFPPPTHIATTPPFILWVSTVNCSWNSEAWCIYMAPLLKLCGRKMCCWLASGEKALSVYKWRTYLWALGIGEQEEGKAPGWATKRKTLERPRLASSWAIHCQSSVGVCPTEMGMK